MCSFYVERSLDFEQQAHGQIRDNGAPGGQGAYDKQGQERATRSRPWTEGGTGGDCRASSIYSVLRTMLNI